MESSGIGFTDPIKRKQKQVTKQKCQDQKGKTSPKQNGTKIHMFFLVKLKVSTHGLAWWFGIRIGVPLSNNHFHKGQPINH